MLEANSFLVLVRDVLLYLVLVFLPNVITWEVARRVYRYVVKK